MLRRREDGNYFEHLNTLKLNSLKERDKYFYFKALQWKPKVMLRIQALKFPEIFKV